MNFLVLGKFAVDLPQTKGICIIQNLYKSFNCPDGYFYLFREDLNKISILNDNIINIARDKWEQILHPMSKQDVLNLGINL